MASARKLISIICVQLSFIPIGIAIGIWKQSFTLGFMVIFGLILTTAIIGLVFGRAFMMKASMESWEARKQWGIFGVKVKPEFSLIQDETIIIPMTTAWIVFKTVMLFAAGAMMYPRDIIVTNKRILVGLAIQPPLGGLNTIETFGTINLYRKGIDASTFSRSFNIDDIQYGEHAKQGPFADVKLKSVLGYYKMKIYTPEARKIVQAFS